MSNLFKWSVTTHLKGMNPCRFFHKWKVVADNGYTVYKECTKCKSRKFKQPKSGYQPIDISWMTYVTDELENVKTTK